MTTGIIIQARLGSSRFPRKVMQPINGKKLIDIVVDECKRTGHQVIVATPSGDKELIQHLINKVDMYNGPDKDVIARFYKCAKQYKLDTIVRVTGDAKNIRSELIQQQVDNHAKYGDIVYGNFCEVFSFNMLEHYYYHDKRIQTREHVTMGMLQDMTVDWEIDLI